MRNVIVVFSKDRPMQLDACLNSLLKSCKLINWEVKVLYACSNGRYFQAYEKLHGDFPEVSFVQQGAYFKIDLMKILDKKKLVFFVVDDAIFTNKFNLIEIEDLLSHYQMFLGFSLRLGKNTNYCYPCNAKQNEPRLATFDIGNDNFMRWNWTLGNYDWGYPLELSSSVYRVKDIEPYVMRTSYSNPNALEAFMDIHKDIYAQQKPFLASYKTSVSFSIPLNRVQNTCMNRFGERNEYSSEELLKKFEDGYRIDVDKFKGFVSNACHQEVDLEFYRKNNEN